MARVPPRLLRSVPARPRRPQRRSRLPREPTACFGPFLAGRPFAWLVPYVHRETAHYLHGLTQPPRCPTTSKLTRPATTRPSRRCTKRLAECTKTPEQPLSPPQQPLSPPQYRDLGAVPPAR